MFFIDRILRIALWYYSTSKEWGS